VHHDKNNFFYFYKISHNNRHKNGNKTHVISLNYIFGHLLINKQNQNNGLIIAYIIKNYFDMRKITLLFFIFFYQITIGLGQYKDLLDFNGTNGSSPGNLIFSGNTLFGVSGGHIYSLNMDGTGYKNIATITGATGSLTLIGNTLYGFTVNGGAKNLGSIYSIHTDGTGYVNLYDFDNVNGANPNGSLTLSGTTFYGVTQKGGNGYGNIFSINIDGTGYKNLYMFSSTGSGFVNNDLIIIQNVLYGTTTTKPDISTPYGSIYSINPNGTGYKVLHPLEFPVGGLAFSGNTIYGCTHGGNNGAGAIYSINADGSGFKSIFNGQYPNDAYPYGTLIVSSGILYGMTSSPGGAGGVGAIFSINIDGTGNKTLFDFNGSNGIGGNSLIMSNNILYGTTSGGGPDYVYNSNIGKGLVFKFALTTTTGIKSLQGKESQLVVYPNPSYTSFTVSFKPNTTTDLNLSIKNSSGQTIYNDFQKAFSGNYEKIIDLSKETKGTYIVEIISGGQTLTKKIIMQ
jgi:uncharacterized repeat protein (TIGR03803 family)